MITIKRNSFLYALACFPNEKFSWHNEPRNLCKLFWTAVGKALVWLLVACLLGFILGAYLSAWLSYPIATLIDTLVVLGCLALLFGFVVVYTKYEESRADNPGPIAAYIKAYKEKHCPMVDYVD